jgi:anaerobic selenocysteine-containing dehydrogenase
MADIQMLVGKALSDEGFVKKLVANPEGALKEVGVEATPEMIEALKGIDVESLKKLAAAFGQDKAA